MTLKQKLIIWWTVPWNPLKEMITITQAVTMLVYNWLAFSSSLPPLRPWWSLGREFIKPQLWLIVISRPLYLWSWLAAADGTLAEYKTHQSGGKTECGSKTGFSDSSTPCFGSINNPLALHSWQSSSGMNQENPSSILSRKVENPQRISCANLRRYSGDQAAQDRGTCPE